MLNQSTINGTRIVEGAVIATVNVPVIGGVRFDRADSQPKHLGKRLHQRRLPALPCAHRLTAVRSKHASAAACSYASFSAAATAAGESWRMRMPAGRLGPAGATAPSELPASAWASLVLSRAV
jgi:hypothetical protein